MKSSKSLIALFLLIVLPLSGMAQEIQWSDNVSFEYAFHEDILFDSKGNMYTIERSKEVFQVQRIMGKKPQLDGTFKIELNLSGDGKLDYLSRVLLNDELYVFAVDKGKRSEPNRIMVKQVKLDGRLVMDWKEFLAVDDEYKGKWVSVGFSPDYQAIVAYGYVYREGTKKIKGSRLTLFNSKLEKIREFEVCTASSDVQFNFDYWWIDEKGNWVFVGLAKPYKKSRGNSRIQLIRVDSTGKVTDEWDIPLGTKRSLIGWSNIQFGKEGTVHFASYYQDYKDKKGKKPRKAGMVTASFSIGKKEANYAKFNQFDEETLKQIAYRLRYKKKGLEFFEWSNYKRIEPVGEGKFVAVIEQYVLETISTGGTGYFNIYDCGDILLIGTDNSGNISWQKSISKKSKDLNAAMFASCSVVNKDNGELCIFFIEHKDFKDKELSKKKREQIVSTEPDKGYLMMFTITSDGELNSKILTDLEGSGYYVYPRYCRLINESTLMLIATKNEDSGKVKNFGKLQLSD